MIPYTWLGALALAIFWTNVLLIVSVAWLRATWIRRNRWPPRFDGSAEGHGYVRARLVAGRGPKSAVARHRVEQRGRRWSARSATVGWHDRAYDGEVFGGEAEWDGGRLTIRPDPANDVWPSREHQEALARCPDRDRFDAVYAEATKAKGFFRNIEVTLKPDDIVFVAGDFSRNGDHWTVGAGGSYPLVFSEIDPRRWARAAVTRLQTFSLGVVALAGAITALCLTPPLFGAISTAGGALALLFFLLVQPAGTWIRDLTLEPSRRPLQGIWTA